MSRKTEYVHNPCFLSANILKILGVFAENQKRKKGMEIIRSKPLIFNSQKISSFISWMIYPILVVLLYFIITHRHWLKIIQ
ncbi:hypothetical protein DW998_07430 [Parabacteroides distasonis]|nr:hypothetical protein DW998_07430 [Parabacteroides distasonis]